MTDRRRAEQQAAFQRAVLDSMPAQIAVLDRRATLIAINAAWRRFAAAAGCSSRCDPGVNFLDVCARATPGAAADAHRAAEGVRRVFEGSTPEFRQDIVCESDDGPLWFHQQVVPLTDGRRGAIVSYTDITTRKQLEAEAAHRVMHDQLTGLPNRRVMLDRLEHALLARHGRIDTAAVLLVGLDGFALVNDRHGHTAGDAVLIEVARRLSSTVRAGDTVSRMASDEFVVVCERVRSDRQPNVLAQRIRQALIRPVSALGHAVRVDVSIGIAVRDSGNGTAEEVVTAASHAMIAAKAAGGGRSVTFQPGTHDVVAERADRALALRDAAHDGALVLHYQPIVNLTTGRATGAEALLRWTQPDGSVLPADTFIELAEDIGVLREIGPWSLAVCCREVSTAGDELDVYLNLSARQLDDRLPGQVESALDGAGIPAERLVLELTERSVLADPGRAQRLLQDLRRTGVRIALDDFGTGYSSLAVLSRLPVDIVKVDRSFIERLGAVAEDSRVVEAVLRLAAALGLDVVAEGIETSGQRDALLDLGCRTGQGQLFAPAVSAADLPAAVAPLPAERGTG